MSKVNRSSIQRHKKVLKYAKGFWGRSKSCYRIAKKAVEHAWQYAYRDRRNKKRDIRALWIQRINAASREHGLTYAQFIGQVHKTNIELDRKTLSYLAINDPIAFKAVVDKVRTAVAA